MFSILISGHLGRKALRAGHRMACAAYSPVVMRDRTHRLVAQFAEGSQFNIYFLKSGTNGFKEPFAGVCH